MRPARQSAFSIGGARTPFSSGWRDSPACRMPPFADRGTFCTLGDRECPSLRVESRVATLTPLVYSEFTWPCFFRF